MLLHGASSKQNGRAFVSKTQQSTSTDIIPAMPVSLPLFMLLWLLAVRVKENWNILCIQYNNEDLDTCMQMMLVVARTIVWQNRSQLYVCSINRKLFYQSLSPRMRRLCERRMPRAALQDLSESAWRRLCISQNEQLFFTLTGFDYQTFHWLLQLFEPVFQSYSQRDNEKECLMVTICHSNHGRPRLMTAADCHGLNLAWRRLQESLPYPHLWAVIGIISITDYKLIGMIIYTDHVDFD